jgi:hypothetical protein
VLERPEIIFTEGEQNILGENEAQTDTFHDSYSHVPLKLVLRGSLFGQYCDRLLKRNPPTALHNAIL